MSQSLKWASEPRRRFQPYMETDSPFDDLYTPGVVPSKTEWYGKFVTVLPLR